MLTNEQEHADNCDGFHKLTMIGKTSLVSIKDPYKIAESLMPYCRINYSKSIPKS